MISIKEGDAFRMAFNRNLVSNGEILMGTIKSRQKACHSYNEETAKGNYREGSDIDLTVYGKNLSIKTIYNIEEKIEER